ncbi:acetyl-CoA carboxylase biotin carboxyl carrier protein [Lentibacter sp.]|uniref:acetyl-CoA carboxylase biotin carboxyl carrier protein n=1 Tax=Lentibacter sp. TaxID=2024994 RepID=UPI003F6BD7A8
MALSYREVADILKIIDSSSCDEVILEQDGVKLVIRRGAPAGASQQPSTQGNQPVAVPIAKTEQSKSAPTPAPAMSTNMICAPMVGTFYARKSPDEDPFVQVGAQVQKGMPVCVIEVMKLFTTIEATKEGVIEAVLVEDGQLVEFDQPLFILR